MLYNSSYRHVALWDHISIEANCLEFVQFSVPISLNLMVFVTTFPTKALLHEALAWSKDYAEVI
jgi:hypothetical protein